MESSDEWRLQGWVLRPSLSNIFVSDVDSGIKCTLSKFTDDTELLGAVDMLEGRDVPSRRAWTVWRGGTVRTS